MNTISPDAIWGVSAAAGLALFLWLGLPRTLKSLGLHPDYQGPSFHLPGKRALIITTSHATLDRPGRAGGKPTGVFGSELTQPYYTFLDGGRRVDVSSLRGGQIPIEPDSFRWFIACAQDRRYLGDPELQRQTQQSIPLSAVDFKLYDIIFLSGGWGAAYDLAQSEALGEGITQAWASGAVIGGVCHGPLGLLQARDETGKPLVEGRKLTAVTDAQVRQLGITFTPKHPEREMRAAGGRFEAETKLLDIFSQHVVVDGRLVTGQNQNAGVATAQEMMRAAGGKAQ